MLRAVVNAFDTDQKKPAISSSSFVNIARLLPFIAIHLACIAVIWVGFSAIALLVAVALYLVRMFAITAFYHRYFSHKTFKTSRVVAFIFAFIGNTSGQRGPLWWAAHHRHHHRHSDDEQDAHSPKQQGFCYAHVGWIGNAQNYHTDYKLVKDFDASRELRWLNRFDSLAPVVLAVLLFASGELLAAFAPQLGTNGWQLFIWGFCISTTVLYHATFTINSLAHSWGSRRYETKDTSRNNALLALITLGEGWHNNHHHYAASVRQGFRWWQIDLAYYALRLMALCGLVWDLKPVPRSIIDEPRVLLPRSKAPRSKFMRPSP